MKNTLILALICTLALILGGCSYRTGPTSAQSRDGQSITNSPNNSVTLTDDLGTTAMNVAGPTSTIDSTADGVKAHNTGQVIRGIVGTWLPDGTRKFSVISGSDIAAGGVKLNPATGEVSIDSFSTSSSTPLAALGELQAKTTDAVKAISADQAEVLKTISNDQRDTILGIAKQVSPEFLQAVKVLLGG